MLIEVLALTAVATHARGDTAPALTVLAVGTVKKHLNSQKGSFPITTRAA